MARHAYGFFLSSRMVVIEGIVRDDSFRVGITAKATWEVAGGVIVQSGYLGCRCRYYCLLEFKVVILALKWKCTKQRAK